MSKIIIMELLLLYLGDLKKKNENKKKKYCILVAFRKATRKRRTRINEPRRRECERREILKRTKEEKKH